MNYKNIEIPSSTRILLVVFFSVLATGLMVHLNAYDNLHSFINAYAIHGLKEFFVFTPAFLAMGFVLHAVKQIEELEDDDDTT